MSPPERDNSAHSVTHFQQVSKYTRRVNMSLEVLALLFFKYIYINSSSSSSSGSSSSSRNSK